MAKAVIRLHPENPVKIPLQAVSVGRASVLDVIVLGAPEGLQELQFHVSRPGSEDHTAIPAKPLPDNRWAVYANGFHFPDVGSAKYHVTGKDEHDNQTWLGWGRLDIQQSVLHVEAGQEPIIPDDTFIRNPATGLWHRVTAALEGDEIVLQYEKEGVSR